MPERLMVPFVVHIAHVANVENIKGAMEVFSDVVYLGDVDGCVLRPRYVLPYTQRDIGDSVRRMRQIKEHFLHAVGYGGLVVEGERYMEMPDAPKTKQSKMEVENNLQARRVPPIQLGKPFHGIYILLYDLLPVLGGGKECDLYYSDVLEQAVMVRNKVVVLITTDLHLAEVLMANL